MDLYATEERYRIVLKLPGFDFFMRQDLVENSESIDKKNRNKIISEKGKLETESRFQEPESYGSPVFFFRQCQNNNKRQQKS